MAQKIVPQINYVEIGGHIVYIKKSTRLSMKTRTFQFFGNWILAVSTSQVKLFPFLSQCTLQLILISISILKTYHKYIEKTLAKYFEIPTRFWKHYSRNYDVLDYSLLTNEYTVHVVVHRNALKFVRLDCHK